VGAVCGKAARTVLCGGRSVMSVPTAIIIVLGEEHLRRILKKYAAYYNGVRTHRSLNKDAPIFRPVQQIGIIRSNPILGGLHHHYVRV
jgi:hypothetical protein